MAADGKSKPGVPPANKSRISQLTKREGKLRDLGDKIRSTPAAGAGPEMAARRDDLLRRVDEAQERVKKELKARDELRQMQEKGEWLMNEFRSEGTTERRRAEIREQLPKRRAERDAKLKEVEEQYGMEEPPKGSKDAEEPCVECVEAEQLEEDARKATEEKLELARGLCDVTGSADEADKELVAQELAKMPREDLEKMKANGTRVAVCRGSVTDCKQDLAGFEPRGWPEGTDWSSVPGCFDDESNRVIVATRGHGTEKGPHVPDTGDGHGSANLAIHEAYHGLDYKNGKPSSATDFTDVMKNAPGELSDYMSQSGQAGEEETFAESAARRYGCPPNVDGKQPRLDDYWRSNPLGRTPGGGKP